MSPHYPSFSNNGQTHQLADSSTCNSALLSHMGVNMYGWNNPRIHYPRLQSNTKPFSLIVPTSPKRSQGQFLTRVPPSRTNPTRPGCPPRGFLTATLARQPNSVGHLVRPYSVLLQWQSRYFRSSLEPVLVNSNQW